MVDLSLFTDWKCCSACGLPLAQKPKTNLDPAEAALLLGQFEDAVASHGGNAVAVARVCPQFESFLDPLQTAELARARPPNNKPPAKLMACADCSCVAYHNATCQKAHWKTSHKRECKILASAILPLKEFVRWHKMNKKMKKHNNLETTVAGSSIMSAGGGEAPLNNNEGGDNSGPGGGKRVWCWWEPDNENGITEETLSVSSTLWKNGAQKWQGGDYLVAMQGFQNSLEPYRKAWPYIGKSSGTNERREDNDLYDFYERSLSLAKRLLFCAYCELDASQVDSARQRLVQCLSITMTIFFTTPSLASREFIKVVMNDAFMELMLRYVVAVPYSLGSYENIS